MTQYVKYVSDRLIYSLTNKKLYHVENSLSYMDTISMETKTNFFESRASQYQLSHSSKSNNKIEFTEDF
jgi:ribonucleoside-diphosphate reductase subunit M2